MATVEVFAVISADSGLGSAGIPYVGSAHFPIVEDFSGSGYTGLMLNMESGDIAADVPGGSFDIRSLAFGGTDEYVSFGDVLAFERTDPFSFSFWVKGTASDQLYIWKGNDPSGAGDYRGYVIRKTGNDLFVSLIHDGGGAAAIDKTFYATTLGDGSWHHVVVTVSGSSLASGVLAYVDGVLATVDSVIRDLLSTTMVGIGPLQFGRWITNYTETTMDEVAVYDKELNSTEVTWLYNSGVPRDLADGGAPSNLVGWWRLGEATRTAYTSELSQNFGLNSGVTADSSVASDAGLNYAINASPMADSLCSGTVWMGWGAYSICGAEASLGSDAGVNYALDSSLLADSSESANAGVNFAIDAGLSADSSSSSWVFEELTCVAGCMADSQCSASANILISCGTQMAGISGFVCPGFDKTHHEMPSPNPPAKVPVVVRYVPPAPNPPSYGVSGTGGRSTAPTVQTPMRQPTIVRKRQAT